MRVKLFTAVFCEGGRQGAHPTSHERLHDLQHAPPSTRAPEAPEPRQPHGQQDPGRVVVPARPQSEAGVQQSSFTGSLHLLLSPTKTRARYS